MKITQNSLPVALDGINHSFTLYSITANCVPENAAIEVLMS